MGPVTEPDFDEQSQGSVPGKRSPSEQAADNEAAASSGHADKQAAVGTRGRYFGDYELLEEIGRGGMGVVYKARRQNRIVALKMIKSGRQAEQEDVQRFCIEAKAASKLNHPGIVPILEVGQHDGQRYYAMGFVDGESLASKVSGGPLPPRKAADLTMKIAEAIAYTHGEGVIHCDLTPANILLDKNGQPRVADFGLAKVINDSFERIETGHIVGTPSYMPPEQAVQQDGEIGPWSDVYSIGAILYTLLTGRPPFKSASPMDTLVQVLKQKPLPPRDLNPEVPPDLATICLKCLEKEPRRRYATAGVLVDELRSFLGVSQLTLDPPTILANPGGTVQSPLRPR
jgi:serine/threonine-protein kinase